MTGGLLPAMVAAASTVLLAGLSFITSMVLGVVAKTIATVVIATLAVGGLVSAGSTTGQAFIVGAPLAVLAGVFLRIWQRRGGLTVSKVVE